MKLRLPFLDPDPHAPFPDPSTAMHDPDGLLIDGYPAFGKPFNIEALKRFIDEQLSRHPTLVLAAGRLKNGTIAGQ